MTEWLIADTHFGHKRIIELCYRPADHEYRMLRSLDNCLQQGDIVIHLGDVSIGADQGHHKVFLDMIGGRAKTWLIQGNHDNRNFSWYLGRGWDFVGQSMSLERYGLHVVMTHRPCNIMGTAERHFDVNIHGHLHTGVHRPEYQKRGWYGDSTHFLVSMELQSYAPISLQTVIGRMREAGAVSHIKPHVKEGNDDVL